MSLPADLLCCPRCPRWAGTLAADAGCPACGLAPERSGALLDFLGEGRQAVPHPEVNRFYESIARMPHRLRRGLGRMTRRPVRALDPILRRRDLEDQKKLTWIADQYEHPLEWCLPLPAVVDLLASEGFAWVRSVPPAPERARMFDTTPRPGALPLWLQRVGWALSLGDEDAGLVCVVARRTG